MQADLVLYSPNVEYLIIECKSQTSSGSVDEKYPYLNENIKNFPYQTIIILEAPKAKEGAKNWLKQQVDSNDKLLGVFDLTEFRLWATTNLR
jgi:hypothetical protein